MVTKLKNTNCDKTQKLKLGPNSKTQIVTKLNNSNIKEEKNKKKIVTKLKKSNCDKTQILKLGQNSKNINCDKTQEIKL